MDNIINVSVYRSERKNSRVEFIDLLHFRECDKETDIEKFRSFSEKLFSAIEKLKPNREIIIQCHLYTEAAANMGSIGTGIGINTEKQNFGNYLDALRYVFKCYMFMNNSNALSWPELKKDPSIDYWKNHFSLFMDM